MAYNGFQPGAVVNTQSFGNRPESVEVPHLDSRAPATSDTRYPLGKWWVDVVNGNAYILTSFTSTVGILTANWVLSSVSSSFVAPGSITATSGNITATNGNLVLGTAGNKISIATGTNASIGLSTAMTAGAITISTTAITASSRVFLTAAVAGGTQGTLRADPADYVAGTSFVIRSSSGTDTSTVSWWIIN